MIETKTFEVRDAGTFIPAIGMRIAAFEMEEGLPRYLARRAGYGEPLILFGRLEGRSRFEHDPYDYQEGTMSVAHQHVQEHWDELEDGALIDVEFIRGLRAEPKVSELFTVPL